MTIGIGWGSGVALTAVAATIGTAAYFGLRPETSTSIVAPVVLSDDTSAPIAESGAAPEDVASDLTDPASETSRPVDSAGAVTPPTLDIVRIDGSGSAVVAGTAERNADVVLRIDGRDVATTKADDAGNFVSFFDLEADEAPRVLTLESQAGPDAGSTAPPVASQDRIIVAPVFPVPPAMPSAGPVATASAGQTINDSVVEDAVEAPIARASVAPVIGPKPPGDAQIDTAAAAASNDAFVPPAAPPQAPRLFRDGPDGLSVISAGLPPSVGASLAIDAISYDAQGDVSLTGTGLRDSQLRIYLDGAPVQLAEVGPGGIWTSPLPNVESGVYTLRVDAVSPDGAVTARVETPFQRTAPDVAVASRRDGINAITVQPGFTLWAISEGHFGDGVQYVQIFENNRSQIRDPDLIFPGQVFDLPPVE